MVSTMTPYGKIRSAIDKAISPKGEVYSSASSKLSTLRRKIIDLKNSINGKLEEILRSSRYEKMIQEPIITTRQGRYVVPVRAEYRGRFKGIVHDQSSSGVTIFMEPLILVEKTNKLKQAELDEKAEIDLILKNLSEMVGSEAGGIERALEVLTDLDLIIAKARFSLKFRATRPAIAQKKMIKIINGRHPMLTGEVVPISVELGKDFKCLVITGPNTGGKTVTLKMTGLFPLMAQSGLFIPADEGSVLSCWNFVYADIGDEQSIVQSLSTFSAHIKQIAKILEKADENSLVLLDELGAGTDPSEGALLAIAILKHLIKRGSLSIITTHHNRLKAFAALEGDAENASVDFDLETLKPVYNLTIGQAGRSQALVIAERLGMPKSIIDDAKSGLSETSYEIDNLLKKIREDSEVISREKEDAFSIKRDLEVMQRRATTNLEKEEEKTKKIIEDLTDKSSDLLFSVRKKVKEARQQLKKLFRKQKEMTPEKAYAIMDKLSKDLEIEQEKVEEFVEEILPPPPPPPEPVKAVRAGDYVKVISLGYEGYVTEVPDGNDEVKVQVGMMTINAKLSDLALSREAVEEVKEEIFGHHIESEKILDVPREIKLISKRAEEALYLLEKYIDDARLARHDSVRIVHGKGTGVLRKVVKEFLSSNPYVASFRLGGIGEGGTGVTIAELKGN